MNHLLKIDRAMVEANIRECCGQKKPCLMVKADCYGIGNTGIKMLVDMGYDYFGVSTIEEAINIRNIADDVEILIVSYIEKSDITTCIAYNINFTVYSIDMLKLCTPNAKFHLKIDTNMGRIGFQIDELEQVKANLGNLKPQGIFTHLANASNSDKTADAVSKFQYALDFLDAYNYQYIHIYNTFGSLNYNTTFDNMVRIGIGIWGYFANIEEANLSVKKLQPALSLQLTISHQKQYKGYISYDHIDYVDGLVYTSPLGYHDGLLRCFHGYNIPNVGQIVGKINMCQHMILSSSQDERTMYTLFENEQLYDLTKYGQITNYEFLVSLSSRIRRVIV